MEGLALAEGDQGRRRPGLALAGRKDVGEAAAALALGGGRVPADDVALHVVLHGPNLPQPRASYTGAATFFQKNPTRCTKSSAALLGPK